MEGEEEVLELLRLEATLREVLIRRGREIGKLMPKDTREGRLYAHLHTVLEKLDLLRKNEGG